MKTQIIVPTAGSGTRLKSKTPKPLVLLNGRPLFIYCLETFQSSVKIDSIILVVHPRLVDPFKRLVAKFKISKVKRIVAGGKTRCQSVQNGLKALDADTKIVAIHDGARPLISKDIVERAIKLCEKQKAVVVAVAVKPTIKKVDRKTGNIIETLNRSELWEIQTPQVFDKDLLLKAHQKNKDLNATDDSVLVEKLGVKVKVIEGDYKNIKVTTAEDLVIAKAFLK